MTELAPSADGATPGLEISLGSALELCQLFDFVRFRDCH